MAGPVGLAGMNLSMNNNFSGMQGINPMMAGGFAGGSTNMNAMNMNAMNMNAMGMMNGLGGMNAGMAMMHGLNGFNSNAAAMGGGGQNHSMTSNYMNNIAASTNSSANANGSTNGNGSTNANGSTSGSTDDQSSSKRDSLASFMDTLNRDSFLATAGMAGMYGNPGRDSSLLSARSSLAAAGMAGGLNASQIAGLNGSNPMAAAAAAAAASGGHPLQRDSFLQNTAAGAGGLFLNDQLIKAQLAHQQQLAFQQTYGTTASSSSSSSRNRNRGMAGADGDGGAGGSAAARPAKKARKSKKGGADGKVAASVKAKDVKWMSMLELLKEYQSSHGDCIVPRGYAPNPKLASWVAEQRKQYKLLRDGKPSNITAERVGLLQSIGFAWNAQEAAWTRHFSDLQNYKARYGDCLVPLSYADRPQLGLWVKEQRRHYMLLVQGRKSHMTDDRIAKLESIGFVWDSHEATWWDRFNDLKAYRDLHGNCMVPTKYGPNPRLGTWVHHQRRQHRKLKKGKPSHMTKERMEALTSIGFCWSPRGKGTNFSEFGSEED